MHVAVNRRAPDQGPDAEPLLPDEALTVVEALAGYTTGTAYLNGLEDVTGRLEVGYAADVVAVDADVLGGDPIALGRDAGHAHVGRRAAGVRGLRRSTVSAVICVRLRIRQSVEQSRGDEIGGPEASLTP